MSESAKYIKIVEWSDEDECFIGYCPGIIECLISLWHSRITRVQHVVINLKLHTLSIHRLRK